MNLVGNLLRMLRLMRKLLSRSGLTLKLKLKNLKAAAFLVGHKQVDIGQKQEVEHVHSEVSQVVLIPETGII